MQHNRHDLILIKEPFEKWKVKPVIDRCCYLEETPSAFRYFKNDHPNGKIVRLYCTLYSNVANYNSSLINVDRIVVDQ